MEDTFNLIPTSKGLPFNSCSNRFEESQNEPLFQPKKVERFSGLCPYDDKESLFDKNTEKMITFTVSLLISTLTVMTIQLMT